MCPKENEISPHLKPNLPVTPGYSALFHFFDPFFYSQNKIKLKNVKLNLFLAVQVLTHPPLCRTKIDDKWLIHFRSNIVIVLTKLD